MIAFSGFTPAGLKFLRGLARNNRKEWFEANREPYESELKEPMRALVDEFDAVLGDIAPEIRGDMKKSVFRIHRDVRFSADKSPYKVHIACWFFHHDAGHGVGQEAHGGAGFYLHVEPAKSMLGGGIWMPPKFALDRIREALAENPASFSKIVNDKGFKRRFGTMGDEAMLSRVPRGYAPDHPAAEWLRYKSFTAGRMLNDTDVGSRKLIAAMKSDYTAMLPFVRWLNRAIGLPERKSR